MQHGGGLGDGEAPKEAQLHDATFAFIERGKRGQRVVERDYVCPRCCCHVGDLVERETDRVDAAFQLSTGRRHVDDWSHADDVTLMGAFGGRRRGWALVGARLDWVSRINTEGKGTYAYDKVASIVGSDLALFVQIEHIAIPQLHGGKTGHLRVTHVMRCESGSCGLSLGTLTRSWRPLRRLA